MDGWLGRDGRIITLTLLRLLEHSCGAKKGVVVARAAVKGVLFHPYFMDSSDNTKGPRRCKTFDIENFL